MKLNHDPSELKVGDRVTSDFLNVDIHLIRRITWIEKDETTGSGYRASVDGGEPCQCCGKVPGVSIIRVDAAWFRPVRSVSDQIDDNLQNPFEHLR